MCDWEVSDPFECIYDEPEIDSFKLNSDDYLYPPYECVPWFLERFHIGDQIGFLYNGGLGGVYPIIGELAEINMPYIKISGLDQDWLLGDIIRIKNFF
ncbi:hypothetical protein D3C73_278960 [compost metagenome]